MAENLMHALQYNSYGGGAAALKHVEVPIPTPNKGVVDGTSEAIFQTLMSLGPSRSEWDFCFYKGSVVEHLDGHTDIVLKQLYSDWLPWGMKRRDLLLRRYWRREDDGTYVILYHLVVHKKCSPQKSYVCASLKSAGYVISPVTEGKHSVVKL
ncbi:protein ENHANCED DISEASE RESISTANCE 2 isoform X4 [Gossypium raimondii]|nr:protein ENHANCED DISEASE RESISTANCE 2 isoform X4 [Gossypium raimondii]